MSLLIVEAFKVLKYYGPSFGFLPFLARKQVHTSHSTAQGVDPVHISHDALQRRTDSCAAEEPREHQHTPEMTRGKTVEES